jgi:hypothetical protein
MANGQLMIGRTRRHLPPRDRPNLNGHIRVGGRPAWRRPLHRRDLLAAALRRDDDQGGGGPHDEPLRRQPRAEIRSFDGVSDKGLSFPECDYDLLTLARLVNFVFSPRLSA